MVVKRKRRYGAHFCNAYQLATNPSKPRAMPSEGRGQGFESLRARH
jgi:hypothetical protein